MDDTLYWVSKDAMDILINKEKVYMTDSTWVLDSLFLAVVPFYAILFY